MVGSRGSKSANTSARMRSQNFMCACMCVHTYKRPSKFGSNYKRTHERLYVLPNSYVPACVCSYMLQNWYEQLYVCLYVLPNLHVRSYVLLNLYLCSYVRLYVFPNLYECLNMLPNLCVKKRIYYTFLSYTTDTILSDLGTVD